MASIDEIGFTLKGINPDDVKIHATLFKLPFYTDTVLDRKNVLQSPVEVILRKNIYFLARRTVNVVDFITQLVQMGFLTLRDRRRIMMLNTETVRVIECYINVVQKSPSKYEELLQVLRLSSNTEILGLLELHQAKAEEQKPNQPSSSAGIEKRKDPFHRARAISKLPPKHLPQNPNGQDGKTASLALALPQSDNWSCKRCTFENENQFETCYMCTSAKNVEAGDMEGSIECPQCTLLNFTDVKFCVACEHDMTNYHPLMRHEIGITLQEEENWDD